MKVPGDEVEKVIIGDRVIGELELARTYADSDLPKAIRCLADAIEELHRKIDDIDRGLMQAFPK